MLVNRSAPSWLLLALLCSTLCWAPSTSRVNFLIFVSEDFFNGQTIRAKFGVPAKDNCKDLNHTIETTIYKWMFRFQVHDLKRFVSAGMTTLKCTQNEKRKTSRKSNTKHLLRDILSWILSGMSCFFYTSTSFLCKNDHQQFQVPKMEVLNLIRLFLGWVSPYMSLTNSLYRWVPPF